MEQTPGLAEAAARGDVALVRDLVARGADPNAIDAEGWSPLLRAVLGGSRDVVMLLIDAGADVNLRTPDGSTPLLKATLWRNVDAVRELLDRGADAHAADNRGWTALGIALLIEDHELMAMLRRYAIRGPDDRHH